MDNPPCSGKTNLFYSEDENEIEEAVTICQTCPFKDQCLQIGLKENFGVWSGKTVKERRKIKKANRD